MLLRINRDACMLSDMSITLDTQSIEADTSAGPHPRLCDAAIKRAKRRFAVERNIEVAKALGFANTATLWRARVGLTPIRLSDARRIARLLDLPIEQVFEGGSDA